MDDTYVKFAKKKHFNEGESHLRATVLNNKIVPDDSKGSLFIGTMGKNHYPMNYSQEETEKPHKKPIYRKESGEVELRGKKYLAIPAPKPNRPTGTRKIEVALSSDTYEIMMPIKRKVTGFGQKSVEYDMETSMNRKQRVNNERSRNYIPTSHLGDKSYKNADREPGFYKSGGLVIGSSIRMRESTNPLEKSRKQGGDTNVKVNAPLSNHKTFTAKIQKFAREFDINQVSCLTNATVNLGQSVPSWEEKTGYWLCRPEDEND